MVSPNENKHYSICTKLLGITDFFLARDNATKACIFPNVHIFTQKKSPVLFLPVLGPKPAVGEDLRDVMVQMRMTRLMFKSITFDFYTRNHHFNV